MRVGLESHLTLVSPRKLFCPCQPGLESCGLCRGYPGHRPTPPAADLWARVAQLIHHLNAVPAPRVEFYRKIYPYHDLWSGYQRTQHPTKPLARGGVLRDLQGHGYALRAIYLQQDPAATLHQGVDHRRAGWPLIQVVSQIQQYEGVDAAITGVKRYLRTLRQLAQDLGLLDHTSVLKSDLNLSIPHSPRMEVKNVSSLMQVTLALRQAGSILPRMTQDQTYGIRDAGLEFQRVKTRYPFVKDSDIPPACVVQPSQTILTYGELYQRLMALPGATKTLALELCTMLRDDDLRIYHRVGPPSATMNFTTYRELVYLATLSQTQCRRMSELAGQCDPSVDPVTLQRIVRQRLHTQGLYPKSWAIKVFLRKIHQEGL